MDENRLVTDLASAMNSDTDYVAQALGTGFVAEFPAYIAWRERYAPPIIRMPSAFYAAIDQAARYGKQAGHLSYPSYEVDLSRVIDAWLTFLSQFNGTTREVLTRTFWAAFNA